MDHPRRRGASHDQRHRSTNNAFNQHHGIQSEERFGIGVDADGDGFVNELTRADVTAVTIFQATLAVPGRMIRRARKNRRKLLKGLVAGVGLEPTT